MALVASAAVSHAATVTFWTLDDVERTIYFTPNDGKEWLPSVTANSQVNKTVELPADWAGNYRAVPLGEDFEQSMLGEVMFGGSYDLTFYDVSAIVNGTDKNNIKQLWPKGQLGPMSGCEEFPCDNCYWLPDDIQTKATRESNLMTTLGTGFTGIPFTT